MVRAFFSAITATSSKDCLPMRGFKHPASADIVVRGHALVQNLRNGFSTLTATVERRSRLLRAWSQLARSI